MYPKVTRGGSKRFDIKRHTSCDNAFSAIVRGHAYAVLVLADPMLTDHRRWIAELATQSRLPIVHWNSDWPEAGGLMSYGPSNTGMHRRVATYVDKILFAERAGESGKVIVD